jgi:hypothetical protein
MQMLSYRERRVFVTMNGETGISVQESEALEGPGNLTKI